MKKLLGLMLGVALVTGTATSAFAFDGTKKEEKEKEKNKKKNQKKEEKKN